MATTYFEQTGFVSNSTLKDLGRSLSVDESFNPNLQKIFDFGSLIDAYTTDKTEVEKYEQLFDEDEKQKAKLMSQACESDTVFAMLLSTCKTQHEIYRNSFEFTHDGYTLTLPVRIKLDFFKRPVLAGDLKTTASETMKAFYEALYFFDYDQQSALYMDVARVDRFMFVGVGKKKKHGKHPIFKYAVQRGDEMYESGKKKYSYLMFKYYFLIHNLNL
jgi:hypothetical protein